MGHEAKHRRQSAAHTSLALLATAALSLACLLALTPPAQAAPPSHPRLKAKDIAGLNHPCGVAVDNKGDVYASSAGESKVKIFDPSHTEIGFVEDTHEPCGLAVDSHGDLFVTEKATGKVVRYVPDVYPFVGAPSYSSAEAIDSSGTAEGIGVDNSIRVTNSSFPIGGDDSLFVSKGGHIDAYSNESQGVQISATAGTFKLSFKGQETAPLPYNASHAEVQAALAALSTIGAGNVSVTTANFQETDHLIVFTHKLGLANQPPLGVDKSGLTGSATQSETDGGLLATIGEGTLTNATGVAAYSYKLAGSGVEHYVFAADAATDRVEAFSGKSLGGLKARATIKGPKGGEDFGFGTVGAYLAVDPGNGNAEGRKCAAVEKQACTVGHLLVYDEAHKALDEFDASGQFLDQAKDAAFADAEPTAMAIDRSGGTGDGTIYVSAGAGAKLLAFKPLGAPSREQLPEPLSHKALASARSAAVDRFGDLYVAVGSTIKVYGPDGKEITVGPEGKGIKPSESPDEIAVDSTCKVYALFTGAGLNNPAEYKVGYYTPGACPPQAGTQYSGLTIVATGNSFEKPTSFVSQIAINPANDHLFVGASGQIIELGSALEGSPILNPCFACSLLPVGPMEGLGVYGANGDVYVSISSQPILVVNPTGTEVLRRISGAGSPSGSLPSNPVIAVDQSNGHVLAFDPEHRSSIEEYDASGAFVAEFGKLTLLPRASGIAIDNSGGASDGNVYLAFDNTGTGSFDVTAFGRLGYPEVATPEEFKLTVAKTGTGQGIVTSFPAGIDCGLTCEAEFEKGTAVTLSATPSEGSTFAGWSGSGCSGAGTCKVTMSEAKEVTATFNLEAANTKTLTLTKVGTGTLECKDEGAGAFGPCAPTYNEGHTVKLKETPGAGFSFAGWSEFAGSGTVTTPCTGAIAECEVKMDANVTGKATFTQTTPELTVEVEGPGEVSGPGGIACPPACAGTFKGGETVTLTAIPDAGAHFEEWTGPGAGACENGRSLPTCEVEMSADKTVKAIFDNHRTLNVHVIGQGEVSDGAGLHCTHAGNDTPACEETYLESETVTLSHIPAEGLEFKHWEGACMGTDICSVKMSEWEFSSVVPITARFAVKATNPPSIEGESVSNITPTDATLEAQINPNGGGAHYQFQLVSDPSEYSTEILCPEPLPVTTDGCAGNSSPSALPIRGVFGEATPVSLDLASAGVTLQPGTTYHYRVLAARSVPSEDTIDWETPIIYGADQTFTTLSESGLPLAVHHEGAGGGTVAFSPGGFECPSGDCEHSYPEGEEVTLTASPAPGSLFVAWRYCDKEGVHGRQCTVHVTPGHKPVGAKFEPANTITVKKAGNGGGSTSGVTCANTCVEATGTFLASKTVVLKAKPYVKNSEFAGWSASPVSCSLSEEGRTCTLSGLSEDETAQAEFAELPKETLTVSKEGGGQGAVKSTPAGINCSYTCSSNTAYFYKGTPLSLEAAVQAGKGSVFGGFKEGSGSASACSITTPCLFTIEAASALTAKFE